MIEADCLSYLQSQIAGFIAYPGHVPQSIRLQSGTPATVYNVISCTHNHTLAGAGGVATIRLQLSFFGTSPITNAQNAENVRQVLDGYQGVWGSTEILSSLLLNEVVLSEQPGNATDRWIYHRAVDYAIKYRETLPDYTPIKIQTSSMFDVGMFNDFRLG